MEKQRISGKLRRFLYSVWLVRWIRTIFSVFGGVRLSPSAVVVGSLAKIGMAKGCIVGERSRIDLGASGSVVFENDVWLGPDVGLQTNASISIGEATTVQRRCSINGQVRIGAYCLFAPNVFVSSGSHPFRMAPHLLIRQQESRFRDEAEFQSLIDRPVWIQEDCWLGANVVVCPGVTIGKGSIIGANSVVTTDVPPYTVVGGVPARKIGARLEWLPPKQIDAGNERDQVYVIQGQRVRKGSELVGYSVNSRIPFLAVVSECAKTIELRFTSELTTKLLIGPDKFEVDVRGDVLNYNLAKAEDWYGGKLVSVSLPLGVAKEATISRICCA